MNSGGYVHVPRCKSSRYINIVLVLVLFIDPEGDSCFSIYQISLIKKEKVTFCKLKMSLGRNFVNNLQTFCRVHFTILLQIEHENNFLPTNKHRQANESSSLSLYCLYDCFNYRSNFVFQKCLSFKMPSWLRWQKSEKLKLFPVTSSAEPIKNAKCTRIAIH